MNGGRAGETPPATEEAERFRVPLGGEEGAPRPPKGTSANGGLELSAPSLSASPSSYQHHRSHDDRLWSGSPVDFIAGEEAGEKRKWREGPSVSLGVGPNAMEYVPRLEAVTHENEFLPTQNHELHASVCLKGPNATLDIGAASETERLRRSLVLSIELCAIQQLEYRKIMNWVVSAGDELGTKGEQPAFSFASLTGVSVRDEMMRTIRKLGIHIQDFAAGSSGLAFQNAEPLPFSVLQNTTSCLAAQLASETSTRVSHFSRCLGRKQEMERERVELLVQSMEKSVLQKLERVCSSVSYLENKHQMLMDRLFRALKDSSMQKKLFNRSLLNADSRTTELEKSLAKSRGQVEALQQENTELRHALVALRQRFVHTCVGVPLETSTTAILKSLKESLCRVTVPPQRSTDEEGFRETIRVTAIKAEAQIERLTPLLEAQAAMSIKDSTTAIRFRQPNERDTLFMNGRQREYYNRMQCIIYGGKENDPKDAACKSLFSSTPNKQMTSPSPRQTTSPSEKVTSQLLSREDITVLIENLQHYTQHLKNISSLIENDSIDREQFTRTVVNSLRKCEAAVITESKEMKIKVSEALDSLYRDLVTPT